MNDTRIDWDEIHRRIENVNKAIEAGWAPSFEEKQHILRKRAKSLAQRKEQQKEQDTIEVVEFLLVNEHYGIESQYINEVYPLKDYTSLPGVPSFVFGVMNVKGRIISVIDIKRFFNMSDKGISDLNKVVIIKDENMEFGILADMIVGVREIGCDEIGEPLPTLTGIREDYLKGVTPDCLIILDAARILEDRNIIVHEEV